MNYSNTDCLGNPLTNSSPVAFNALAKGNNCATFNGTSDYIYLGENNILGEVDKVEFLYKGVRSTFNVFFTNIFKIQSDDTCGNILLFEDENTLTFRYKGQQYAFTAPVGDNVFHRISIDISSGAPSMTVDGITVPVSAPASNTTVYDKGSYIGFNGTDTNYLIKGSICDFKCYSGDTLLHWYPMAEGAGAIVYDAVGNVNGTITSASLTTFWETKQDIFAYNLINGFSQDSDQATALLPVKHPIGKDLCIYKSNFTSSTDGWDYVSSSVSAANGVVTSTRVVTSASNTWNTRIQKPIGFLNAKQVGRLFRVKFRLKNISDVNMSGVTFSIGTAYAYGSKGLAVIYNSTILGAGETHEYDISSATAGNGSDWSPIFQLYTTFTGATEGSTVGFEVSNIEVYQVNYTEDRPKLEYGHNLAESALDFTQGISGIAELNALTGIDNYTPATAVSGLYKKTITAGEKNYLLYKQAQTDTNSQRINNKETFYD